MSIQTTIKALSGGWFGSQRVEAVDAFDAIESQLGSVLPADYKFFMMWSNGGEADLPGGYLAIFPIQEIMSRQVDELKGLFVFGSEGDHVFAFDLRSRKASADYPVVEFSLASRDEDEIEVVAVGFNAFLRSRMQSKKS